MIGRESSQRSFFDAALAVEGLLEPGSFYELLHRLGPRLISDEDFADCFDPTNGRPSAPPARMFKLLLLQSYEGLSDRQTIERMAFDLRWKAVLGLEVHDRPVAQSTLVEHRARIQLHGKMEEAYGLFLKGLVEAGVISTDQVNVLDSTAIWGRGAVEDTYNLIGSAIRKLLGVSARRQGRPATEIAAEVGLVLTAPADSGSLKGGAGIDWSDVQARREFLNRLVQEARLALKALAEGEAVDAGVAEAAALLRRILLQDLESASAATKPNSDRGGDGSQAVLEFGQEVQIRNGVARDRIVSVGDPEMRHGHKSQNRTWEGYKAHVSVETGHGFITAIEVTPANVHDAEAAPHLIRNQQAHGLNSSANVGDMAYSAAELRVWAREHGTEVVAKVPPAPGTPGCFRKDDFHVDLEAGTVRCPAGEHAHRFVQRSEGGRDFIFDPTVCAGCHLRTQCTARTPEAMRRTRRGRVVTVHRLEPVLQAARTAEGTERVQELLRLRWLAERGIAHLVRRGLRQARYFGTPKVHFQAITTALVVNLARFAGLPLGSSPLHPDLCTA